jgi:hypothetical protein
VASTPYERVRIDCLDGVCSRIIAVCCPLHGSLHHCGNAFLLLILVLVAVLWLLARRVSDGLPLLSVAEQPAPAAKIGCRG